MSETSDLIEKLQESATDTCSPGGCCYADSMTAAAAAITASTARETALVEALQGLLHDYKQLVDSGDCGFWDSEKVPSVIAARAVLDH